MFVTWCKHEIVIGMFTTILGVGLGCDHAWYKSDNDN